MEDWKKIFFCIMFTTNYGFYQPAASCGMNDVDVDDTDIAAKCPLLPKRNQDKNMTAYNSMLFPKKILENKLEL